MTAILEQIFFLLYIKMPWCVAFLSFLMIGCTGDAMVSAVKSVFTLQPAKVWLEKVEFRASDNVNDSSPVTVHVLVVYKPDLLAELSKMDAETYFKKSDQIKIDNAGQIDVFSWDIIRGQKREAPVSPSRVDGEGVLIFARYDSPGPHRASIADDREIMIQLDKIDFKVISTKKTETRK